MRKLLFLCFTIVGYTSLSAQSVILQGYVFESNNRGYLNEAKVSIYDDEANNLIVSVPSSREGKIQVKLPIGIKYRLETSKDLFEDHHSYISTDGKSDGEIIFHKIQLERKPGYIFDVTLANKRESPDDVVDAIDSAWIEVYNNTTQEEVMNSHGHSSPYFKVTFTQGNHYTVLIRKKGYFNKRMEAYVNVKGCILCFDGVGSITPGVADVLTEGHKMGALLANVEMERVVIDSPIKLKNIYYDYNSARVTEASAKELDKVVNLLKDNPALLVELGSHTDSRGKASYNLGLSERRAKSAVDYIVTMGGIPQNQIDFKGYGESRLANPCGEGVECPEEQHQQNRRTEIKVIGIIDIEPMQQKNLAELKEEERFEKLLKELDNQEVIKIEAGGELPEEIRRVTEKNTAADPDTLKNSPIQASPAEGEPDIKARSASTVELETSKAEADAQPSMIVSEPEIIVDETLVKTHQLKPNFSGYMVEILQSPTELPTSHSIFALHGNIILEKTTAGNYAYLLGEFEEWRDANKFLNSLMISQYPAAKLVRYKNGERL